VKKIQATPKKRILLLARS